MCGRHGGFWLLVVAHVVSLSPVAVETAYSPRSVCVGYVVVKQALGQDFLEVLWFGSVMISLPMLDTLFYLSTTNTVLAG